MPGNITKRVAHLKRMRRKLRDGRHWPTKGWRFLEEARSSNQSKSHCVTPMPKIRCGFGHRITKFTVILCLWSSPGKKS